MIDGVPYWDGGFAGNPPLWPLFYETRCRDAIIVQINPIERDRTPRTAQEIADRMNEITFNAGLLAELRAADFVARLIDRGVLARQRLPAREPSSHRRRRQAGKLQRRHQDRRLLGLPDDVARSRPRGGEGVARAELRCDRRQKHARYRPRAQ